MTRLKKIKTPVLFSDIENMMEEYEPGTILLDEKYAGFWFVSDNQVLFLGILDRRVLHGNTPTSYSCFDANVRRELINYRAVNDFTTYGILDPDCLSTVKRSLIQTSSLSPKNKKIWGDLKKMIHGTKVNPQKTMEFGVELELESDDYIESEKENALTSTSSLIDNVGTDGSVENGVEIRFKHPTLRGWKLDEISKVLENAKEIGLKSEWGTAGMHIHISHQDIQKAIKKFKDNIYEMENILYPIGCRTKKVGRRSKHDRVYGTGNDLFRDQYSVFRTLEIRAWNATTDPKVFLTRIRIAKALVEFLLTDLPVSITEFFKWMSKARKTDYKFLLNAENPHEYGLPKDLLLTMLK